MEQYLPFCFAARNFCLTGEAIRLKAYTMLAFHQSAIQRSVYVVSSVISEVGMCDTGTTIAGYHELEKAGVRAGLINAVVAATNRADEISKL